ncbi:MAG TPA: GDSL-type esterase/lipase family protein [Polyangiaceae bacterium]|nr:GDSL-type esterase/lipase family protein [Polyangiaceae bacterium]
MIQSRSCRHGRRWAVLALLGVGAMAQAAQAQTKVACVGDSITEFSGWCENLGTQLGGDYSVMNFGVSGTTLLQAGDHPYWTTDKFTQSHDFLPNIVVIMLGTNDSKPQNWSHEADFVSDYEELIDSYTMLASTPEIFLNLPPPAGTNGFNISRTVIEQEILPLLEQVAVARPVTVVDVFGAFGGHDFDPFLFGSPEDQVHPNAAGAQVIADTVYQTLTASPVNQGGAGGNGAAGSGGGEAGAGGAAGSAGTSNAGSATGGAAGGGAANAGAAGEPAAGGGAGGSGGDMGLTAGAAGLSAGGSSAGGSSAGTAGDASTSTGSTPVAESGSCAFSLFPNSSCSCGLFASLAVALLLVRRRT